jgi:poly(A) polymerase
VSFDPRTRRLVGAEWLERAETQQLMRLLGGEEGRIRAVGGIVRDTILDRPRTQSDVDLATELTPPVVAARAEAAGIAVYPTGIEHGTLTLKLGTLVAEVTTLREDVTTDGRRASVRFGTDWSRDAGRRDFTLNALYAGMDGQLFDPLDGLRDCLAGRVRFIGDPARRIEEDRLRVFRFFRFSASHGGEQFDPAGLAACRAAADRLGAVSAERIGAEMTRMLGLPRIGRTLGAMVEAGVLGFSLETVRRLQSYERRAARPSAAARLALLAAEVGVEPLQRAWRLGNDACAAAAAILAAARLLGDFRINEAAYRYPACLVDGAEVAALLEDWADAGRSALMGQVQAMSLPPRFPLGGDDLVALGHTPGKALGAELERLQGLWIDSGFALSRDALLAAAEKR